jgi:hypothetical protein
VVTNQEWRDLYPNGMAEIEMTVNSDHLPIIIKPQGVRDEEKRKKLFRYEAGWATKEECKSIIKKIWKVKEPRQGTWMAVKAKLNKSKGGLLRWQRAQGQQSETTMKILSNKLLSLQDKTDCVDMEEYKKVHSDLAILQEEEDLRWRQRAKEEWLKFGDQNSKFFHASANQRRKANIITQISDEAGQVWTSQDDIGVAFVGYFQRLFTAEAPTNMQKVLSAVKRKVTPTMNNFLLREFTGEEVNEALNQMAPLKAPGPDGFSVCFFQKNWAAVGIEVSQAVLDIFENWKS